MPSLVKVLGYIPIVKATPCTDKNSLRERKRLAILIPAIRSKRTAIAYAPRKGKTEVMGTRPLHIGAGIGKKAGKHRGTSSNPPTAGISF